MPDYKYFEQFRKCPLTGFVVGAYALLLVALLAFMANPKGEQPLTGSAVVLSFVFTTWLLIWDGRAKRAPGTPDIDAAGHLVARRPTSIFIICLLVSGCAISVNLYGSDRVAPSAPVPTATLSPDPSPSTAKGDGGENVAMRPPQPAATSSKRAEVPVVETSTAQKLFPGVNRILGGEQPADPPRAPTPVGSTWVLVGEQVSTGDYDTDLKAASDFDSIADVRRASSAGRAFNASGLLARTCAEAQPIDSCKPSASVGGLRRASGVAISSDRGVWVRVN